MGQRTQLIVRYNNINGEGKQKTVVYHNQWGIGKMILLDVLQALNFYYSEYDFKSPKSLHKGVDFSGCFKMLEKNPLKKIADFKEVFNECCNNNGGAYLEINLDKYNKIENGNLCFFAGSEDVGNKAFSKKLNLKGWFDIAINNKYQVKSFVDGFNSLLKFYNIKIKTR